MKLFLATVYQIMDYGDQNFRVIVAENFKEAYTIWKNTPPNDGDLLSYPRYSIDFTSIEFDDIFYEGENGRESYLSIELTDIGFYMKLFGDYPISSTIHSASS